MNWVSDVTRLKPFLALSEPGRKFSVAIFFLMLAFATVALSFVLAMKSKMTSDWSSIINGFFLSGGTVVGGFMAANAFITGKTASAEAEVKVAASENQASQVPTVQLQPDPNP